MRATLAVLICLMAAPGLRAGDCILSAADREWIAGLEKAWSGVNVEALKLEHPVRPRIVYFDERCVWDGAGKEHGGQIALPTGEKMPVQLTTFAATFGEPPEPFLVMAMPSIWRATPRHADEPNLDRLTRSVFVHEMTHTQQTASFGARIDQLAKLLGIPDYEMNDDIVQERFGKDPAFRAAYEKERDLLYRAAREKDRVIARQALQAMKERHARFFTGANAPFAELEEIFLTMEGVANWAAYKVAEENVDLIRGSGKYWSQDEGLALFLVLDALVPGWQWHLFVTKPKSILALIEKGSGTMTGPRRSQ